MLPSYATKKVIIWGGAMPGSALANEIAAAIIRARPDTTQFHANRIASNFAAAVRSELRWLDIYEDKDEGNYGQ